MTVATHDDLPAPDVDQHRVVEHGEVGVRAGMTPELPAARREHLRQLFVAELGLAHQLAAVMMCFLVARPVPIETVFNEIQRSNMSKLDHNGRPIYREDGKVMMEQDKTALNRIWYFYKFAFLFKYCLVN